MNNRDKQLDIYRGVTMIYIVCIVHVVHWLMYVYEPLSSLMLVEMPVIFFISGASLGMSNSKRKVVETVFNRAKRVLVPYWIYAAVSLIILAALTFSIPEQYDISQYSYKTFVRVALTLDIPQMPLMAHVWFILPYMILMSLFPLQRSLANRGGISYCVSVCLQHRAYLINVRP